MGACEKRRKYGARSLTDDGTTPTAARVNMRCGFWRDLSPIGAKWALFPGTLLHFGTVCGKKLLILAATIRPPAKFAALLPNLVCNYLPSSQEGSVGSPTPHIPGLCRFSSFYCLSPLLSRRHFGTNGSLSFQLLTLTFLS